MPLDATHSGPTAHRRPDRPIDRVALYAVGIGFVAVAHGIAALGWATLGPALATVFLSAVVLAALFGGYGPGLLATALATLDLAFTFMPPYHSFLVGFDDLVFVVTFSAVALLTSSLQARRRSAEASLRRARDELEDRVRDRTAELSQSQEKLGHLVNDLLVIAEREQRRIGYDLHDGLGQELTGISMLSTALAGQLRGDASDVAARAEEVAELVRQALRHTRELAHGLCPVDLENEGLAAALDRLAALVSRLPGVACTFTATGDTAVDAPVATHLYRIAQEALSNALRHGRARRLTMTLDASPGVISLAIADDGGGFPADAPAGMGLRLMDHRAQTIGATLRVTPSPTGTRVVCELPVS